MPQDLVLPSPPDTTPIALRVTPPAERSLRQGHPWLYEGSIVRQSREGEPGDLAVVFDRKGRFLAVGLWDPLQLIRVRVLQQGQPASIDEAFFRQRLAAAVKERASLGESGTTGYRVVHGENDGMPGLVVDRYEQALVLKLYTAAWLPHLPAVLRALGDTLSSQRVVLRLSRSLQAEPCGLENGAVLAGPALAGPVIFQENGLVFEADVLHGQKTGFFLDQRENRARVEGLAEGRRVLDVFAYSGGFSLYAARGGASAVTSVDLSRAALEAAARNFAYNRHQPAVAAVQHEILVEDAFRALSRMGRARRRFDLVIVDPPAFARRASQVDRALSAYGRLTRLALGVLSPAGLLVQASCSRPVEAESFFAAVHGAARDAGRPLQEVARTGHPVDHPVRFPESSYLKCLYASA